MTRSKNPAAVSLGRLGGKTRSPAKAESSRANGKKGGRPPGRRFTEEEYRANPGAVITHAEEAGIAHVCRADGTVRFTIYIPPDEKSAP